MTTGAFGFELEDIRANNGMTFKKVQHELPTLTPSINGTLIADSLPAADLSSIQDIRGIGLEYTRLITQNLQDPSKRTMLSRLLNRLRNLPKKNWKIQAVVEIRRAFANLKRPIETITPSETSTSSPTPELQAVIEIMDSPLDSTDEPSEYGNIPDTLANMSFGHHLTWERYHSRR